MRALAYALPLIPTALWADAPRVATDIAPVHSIVSAVMEGVGTPDLIVRPGASPHGYSLRPSEAAALNAADLVVWVGPGLTPWMDGPIDALADKAHVVTLMDLPGTALLPYREGAAFEAGHDHDHAKEEGHDDHGHDDHDHAKEEGHDDHGHDDHDHAKEEGHDDHGHDDHNNAKEEGHDDHGHDDHDHAKEEGHDDHDHAKNEAHAHDDHGHEDHGHDDHGHDDHGHGDHAGMDPHAWLAPQNAAAWAGAIAEELGELDPENAATYSANAAAFNESLEAVEAEVASMLEPVKGKPFVVFHDAYQYFEAHFGVSAVGAISAGDAASPSAGRVAEVKARVDALGAVCALTEPQFNPAIADAIGAAKLGEIDPLGAKLEPGAALYGDLLLAMGASLRTCLE